MRWALCSNIDLEYHFRHITSRQQLYYEKAQFEHFNTLIKICSEKKVDVLFIAGNLFGRSNPKNENVERVMDTIKSLTDKGIQVFLLPGHHDNPPNFANDRAIHQIFTYIKGVHILIDQRSGMENLYSIKIPVYKGEIASQPIEIYTLPSISVKFEQCKIEIEQESQNKSARYFIFPSSDIPISLQSLQQVVLKLAEYNFKGVLIGGINNDVGQLNQTPIKVISCPPVNCSDFENTIYSYGLRIQNIPFPDNKESGDWGYEEISLSTLKVKKSILNIEQIPLTQINTKVEKILQTESMASGMFQLQLIGRMSRESYHELKIYNFIEKGKRSNFYFELDDQIQFSDQTALLSSLDPIREFNQIAQEKSSKMKKEDPIRISYEKAMARIKEDWENI